MIGVAGKRATGRPRVSVHFLVCKHWYLRHFENTLCLATHVWSLFLSRHNHFALGNTRFKRFSFQTHAWSCDHFPVLRNGLLRYILFTHVQTCDVARVQSATEWTASVHTSHMSKPVMQLVFKVLRNGLLRCILHTCPNLWWQLVFKVLRNGLLRYRLHTCPNLWCNSCSKCYGMDCLGTYLTHVHTCDVTHAQSATEWDCFGTFFTWCKSCSRCYGMGCFGAYFTDVQTWDVTRVQSATEWTASVHTSHMSTPVM